MSHVPSELRAARERVVAPLFAVLRERGIKRQWFADQLGISRNSLWNYQHGYDRLPSGLVERACQIVGIPTVFVPIPEPRDLYIQQPRSVKSTTTTTAKGQHGDDSQQPQRRTRRTQPTAAAATTHHAPRHGAAPNGSANAPASSAASGARRRMASTRTRAGVEGGLAISGQA